MWYHCINLLKTTGSNIITAFSTSVINLFVFSVFVPLATWTGSVLVTWPRSDRKLSSLRRSFRVSLLPAAMSGGITLLAWTIIFTCFFIHAVYDDHQGLVIAKRKLLHPQQLEPVAFINIARPVVCSTPVITAGFHCNTDFSSSGLVRDVTALSALVLVDIPWRPSVQQQTVAFAMAQAKWNHILQESGNDGDTWTTGQGGFYTTIAIPHPLTARDAQDVRQGAKVLFLVTRSHWRDGRGNWVRETCEIFQPDAESRSPTRTALNGCQVHHDIFSIKTENDGVSPPS